MGQRRISINRREDLVIVTFFRDEASGPRIDFETSFSVMDSPNWRSDSVRDAEAEWSDHQQALLASYRGARVEASGPSTRMVKVTKVAISAVVLLIVAVTSMLAVRHFGQSAPRAPKVDAEGVQESAPREDSAQWFFDRTQNEKLSWLADAALGDQFLREAAFEWALTRTLPDGLYKAVRVASMTKVPKSRGDRVMAMDYIHFFALLEAIPHVRAQASAVGASADRAEARLRSLYCE